jgi:hypothetical protein
LFSVSEQGPHPVPTVWAISQTKSTPHASGCRYARRRRKRGRVGVIGVSTLDSASEVPLLSARVAMHKVSKPLLVSSCTVGNVWSVGCGRRLLDPNLNSSGQT